MRGFKLGQIARANGIKIVGNWNPARLKPKTR